MEGKFKTFVFKDTANFAHPIWGSEFAEGELPTVLANTATIEAAEKLYPHMDFSQIEIVGVNYTITPESHGK